MTTNNAINTGSNSSTYSWAGNPNGNVAGALLDYCIDTTDQLLYYCSTAGNAGAAVWTEIPSNSSGLLPWTVVTTTSQAMVANNGYVSNNASLCTMTLPSTCAVGARFSVGGLGAGGWKIAQNASQLIHFGSSVTTTGTGGSLASTNAFDSIPSILCVVANTTFLVIGGAQGNITVV